MQLNQLSNICIEMAFCFVNNRALENTHCIGRKLHGICISVQLGTPLGAATRAGKFLDLCCALGRGRSQRNQKKLTKKQIDSEFAEHQFLIVDLDCLALRMSQKDS